MRYVYLFAVYLKARIRVREPSLSSGHLTICWLTDADGCLYSYSASFGYPAVSLKQRALLSFFDRYPSVAFDCQYSSFRDGLFSAIMPRGDRDVNWEWFDDTLGTSLNWDEQHIWRAKSLDQTVFYRRLLIGFYDWSPEVRMHLKSNRVISQSTLHQILAELLSRNIQMLHAHQYCLEGAAYKDKYL